MFVIDGLTRSQITNYVSLLELEAERGGVDASELISKPWYYKYLWEIDEACFSEIQGEDGS